MSNYLHCFARVAKQVLSITLFLFLSCTVFAQKKVTGKVTDPDKNPVFGATVSVKGTNVATSTTADGLFSIDVPAGSNILVVSSIGHKAQEINISGRTSIDITMSGDVGELENVIVTALNIERKPRALQYSITTVGGENFTQARENSAVNQLAGRVAGVDVSKIASGPGASTRIVIRGSKTFANNNQPLYVVDGIPIDNNNNGQAGRWGGGDQGDGMSSINPDDIESMTVLKGASASALYGSRAANGVILISTKKGKAQKGLGIEFNSNYVMDKVNNLTDFQQEFGSGGMVGPTLQTRVATKFSTFSQANLGQVWNNGWSSQAWGPRFDGSPVLQFDGVVRPYSYSGDNWDRFYKTGNAFTNSLGITTGGENLNMRFSLADLRSNGVIPNSGYDRINASIAVSSKLGKRITFNMKTLYSNEKAKNRPNVSDSPGNSVQSIYRLPGDVNVLDLIGDPNKPGAVPSLQDQADKGITIYDGVGVAGNKKPGEEFQRSSDLWTQNPYWAAYQRINSDERDRVIPSADVRINLTDFLYIKGQAGMDWNTQRGTQLNPEGQGNDRVGGRREFETRIREINYQWLLGFEKTYNKIGVNAYVGGNRMRRTYEQINANGTGFSSFLFPAINNSKQRSFSYGYSQQGINSLFGSAEISYNNYLYITATGRNDWFSTLNPKTNSIFYPSVGASFVFSDAFTMPSWLSWGKVRATWGQVGNGNVVGPYNVNLAYSPFNTHLGVPFGGYSTGQSNSSVFPNPDLTPFTSTELEFGLEARFLKNRLGIDVTYYDQKTTDDILNASISRASGFTATTLNVGQLSNKGIELLLTGTPVKGSITWDVSFNITKIKNRVESLIPGQTEITIGGDDYSEPRTRNILIKQIVGYPVGMITGKVQQTDAAGNLIFNADGTAHSDGTYHIIAPANHDVWGGLNNSFTWKGINLGFLIDFKTGGHIFSGTNMRMTQQGFSKESLLGRDGEAPLILTGVEADPSSSTGYKPFTKTYTPGEAQNYWNQLGSESTGSAEKFVYDASFIKFRQITLGYSLPKKILGRTPIQGISVSLVARNLAILKKDTPNIDPESNYNSSNDQGLDYFGFPATRTYGFNIRITL